MIQVGLFVAGAWLAERLPAGWLYWLARALGDVLALLPTRPRSRLRRNLARALGLPGDAPAVRAAIRQAYRTQTANYVDLLRSRTITAQEIVERVTEAGEGMGAFHEAMAQRRGLVLVTAHFGRFELLRRHMMMQGVPVTLIVERLQPPALFDFICRLRDGPQFTLVAHDVGIRPSLRALARGEVVAVFTDWDPSGRGVPVQFFGAPARLPGGAALFALRAKAPVFVGLGLPGDGPDRVRAMLDPPLTLEPTGDLEVDVRQGTQRIAAALEHHIRRYPGQWVMFHELWTAGVLECGTT